MKQRHSLTHHVRSHQRTVGIIVLQERNQRGCDRGYLLWRYVHQIHIHRRYYREVCILTTLHHLADESTIVIQRRITLTDDVLRLFLSCQINNFLIIKIGHTILYLTIRSLDKAKFINLSIHTERADQTDVWSFRAFDRTQTTIVCIVYVTHLESSTLT